MRLLNIAVVVAAVVVASACSGGARQKPDGGGGAGTGGTHGGGGSGNTQDGGAGASGSGGPTDGGRADLPPSTGDFPYPGRWWAHLTGTTTDAGTTDAGPFVIHWSASDPADRALWTPGEVYPLAVARGSDGSTIVTHAAPGTSGCWAFYPTTDPDALEVRACNAAPSSAPALGIFRRGPRLIAQIPRPPLPLLASTQVSFPSGAIGGGGDWVAFDVGAELWFWKRDTGQAFDVGSNGGVTSSEVALSPDGRRVMFTRWTPGAQVPSLLAFDTASAGVTDLTAMVPVTPSAQYTTVGLFSPDGGKVVFHANVSISSSYDLIAYDFRSKQLITVAPHLSAYDYGRQTEIVLAGGDHLIYVGYPTGAPSSGSIGTYGYELSTGKRIDLGPPVGLVRIPGDAYAALQTTDALILIDDATFTPQTIVSLPSGGPELGGGLAPSPDGTEVAYLDGQGALKVRKLASGATLTVASSAGCFTMEDPLAPAHSGASHSVAALFAADGAIVYSVGSRCAGGVYGLARYDRATGTAKTYPQLGDDATIRAVSPLGGMVFDTPALPTLLVWPGPPVVLQSSLPQQPFSQDATFVFSANDRYLSYVTNGFLTVRDNSAGTVTKIPSVGAVLTSPVNGTSVSAGASTDNKLTAFLPDGTSWSVGASFGAIVANPTNTTVAFTCGDSSGSATCAFPLEPAAKETMIGNGYPLIVTETQVIFRDLDGVCSARL